MPPAARADPELIRSPCHAGSRIAEFHLRAAALTTDVEISVAHRGDSSLFHNGNVIPALVLAAGRSTRMGRSKAMLPLDGRDTFLTRIVRTFHDAAVDDVVVVVGHEAGAVRATFAPSGLPARFVENREYDRGQLSSLLAGLSVVDRPGVGAVLVTLVDVPLVAAATVRAVIDRYRQTHAPIVRPISGARHGHPLLIDRSLFALLRAADPAAGAKPLVRAYASSEGDVAVGDEGAFVDIDTSEDYERFVISRADFPAGGGRGGLGEGT
jgi:molybdenum cofactor cytidylyltransferase